MSSNLVTAPDKGIGPQAFLRTCAQFATGVAIVSVLDAKGAPHGMTVNSFTSVSLNPPLVLVCVDRKSGILDHFRASEHFAINILRENQQPLSERFARPGEDRFGSLEWYAGENGMPLIPDALAMMECAVFERVEAGDHTILIGEVTAALRHEGRPLLFFDSAYRGLEMAPPEAD